MIYGLDYFLILMIIISKSYEGRCTLKIFANELSLMVTLSLSYVIFHQISLSSFLLFSFYVVLLLLTLIILHDSVVDCSYISPIALIYLFLCFSFLFLGGSVCGGKE